MAARKPGIQRGIFAVLGMAALGLGLLAAPALATGARATLGGGSSPAATDLAVSGTGDRTCTGFADDNGDGICDVCGSQARRGHHACGNVADSDNDGVCDACGSSAGRGAGYVDDDDDGVCDNLGSRACDAGVHGSHGAHHGSNRGTGRGRHR